jgi:hypothetical protein
MGPLGGLAQVGLGGVKVGLGLAGRRPPRGCGCLRGRAGAWEDSGRGDWEFGKFGALISRGRTGPGPLFKHKH